MSLLVLERTERSEGPRHGTSSRPTRPWGAGRNLRAVASKLRGGGAALNLILSVSQILGVTPAFAGVTLEGEARQKHTTYLNDAL